MELFSYQDQAHLMVLLLVCITINYVGGNLFKFEKNHNDRLVVAERVKRALKPGGTADQLTGKPGEGYYMEVEIGTPKQKLNVLIDTGSSNFAVACGPSLNVRNYFKMNESSSFVDTGRTLSVPYTEGSWEGILGTDFVTLSAISDPRVKANIACITKEDKFFINGSNWQGILGLGYAEIARPDSSLEPVFDAMVREHKVDNLFSVQLCGSGSIKQDGTLNGSVFFGGSDPSQYTGDLYSTPVTRHRYYEVVLTDVQVAGVSLNMDCKEYNTKQTIVDTGTTNLRLPDRVFNSLVAMIKQHLNNSSVGETIEEKFWEGEVLKCYSAGQVVPYNAFPLVTLTLPKNETHSLDLVLSSQHYLRLVSDSQAVLPPGDKCFKFGISRIGEGTVLGAVVLEGFYVIFDRSRKQIQFGETTCPPDDPGSTASFLGERSWQHPGGYMDCAYHETDFSRSKEWLIVVYVFAGISVICLVPLIVLIYKNCRVGWCKTLFKRKRANSESAEPFEDFDT